MTEGYPEWSQKRLQKKDYTVFIMEKVYHPFVIVTKWNHSNSIILTMN